ncbi:BA75_02813T0 [Komagataella pastoris]|uniref:BA75_02813T0 n=1 Tax=Komagataella pastoris TaxID=4922 RepID=A0A1B2JCC9_PICPA|nr:BA75_02813T0 [Komagataella pastoris]
MEIIPDSDIEIEELQLPTIVSPPKLRRRNLRRRTFSQRHVFTKDLAELLGLATEEDFEKWEDEGLDDEEITQKLSKNYDKMRIKFEAKQVKRHPFKKSSFDQYVVDFRNYQANNKSSRGFYELLQTIDTHKKQHDIPRLTSDEEEVDPDSKENQDYPTTLSSQRDPLKVDSNVPIINLDTSSPIQHRNNINQPGLDTTEENCIVPMEGNTFGQETFELPTEEPSGYTEPIDLDLHRVPSSPEVAKSTSNSRFRSRKFSQTHIYTTYNSVLLHLLTGDQLDELYEGGKSVKEINDILDHLYQQKYQKLERENNLPKLYRQRPTFFDWLSNNEKINHHTVSESEHDSEYSQNETDQSSLLGNDSEFESDTEQMDSSPKAIFRGREYKSLNDMTKGILPASYFKTSFYHDSIKRTTTKAIRMNTKKRKVNQPETDQPSISAFINDSHISDTDMELETNPFLDTNDYNNQLMPAVDLTHHNTQDNMDVLEDNRPEIDFMLSRNSKGDGVVKTTKTKNITSSHSPRAITHRRSRKTRNFPAQHSVTTTVKQRSFINSKKKQSAMVKNSKNQGQSVLDCSAGHLRKFVKDDRFEYNREPLITMNPFVSDVVYLRQPTRDIKAPVALNDITNTGQSDFFFTSKVMKSTLKIGEPTFYYTPDSDKLELKIQKNILVLSLLDKEGSISSINSFINTVLSIAKRGHLIEIDYSCFVEGLKRLLEWTLYLSNSKTDTKPLLKTFFRISELADNLPPTTGSITTLGYLSLLFWQTFKLYSKFNGSESGATLKLQNTFKKIVQCYFEAIIAFGVHKFHQHIQVDDTHLETLKIVHTILTKDDPIGFWTESNRALSSRLRSSPQETLDIGSDITLLFVTYLDLSEDWSLLFQLCKSFSVFKRFSGDTPKNLLRQFHMLHQVKGWKVTFEVVSMAYKVISANKFDNFDCDDLNLELLNEVVSSKALVGDSTVVLYLRLLKLYKDTSPGKMELNLLDRIVPIGMIKHDNHQILQNRINLLLMMTWLFGEPIDFTQNWLSILDASFDFRTQNSVQMITQAMTRITEHYLALGKLLSFDLISQFFRRFTEISRVTKFVYPKSLINELSAIVRKGYFSLTKNLLRYRLIESIESIFLFPDHVFISLGVELFLNFLEPYFSSSDYDEGDMSFKLRDRIKRKFYGLISNDITEALKLGETKEEYFLLIQLYVKISVILEIDPGKLLYLDWKCKGSVEELRRYELVFYTCLLKYGDSKEVFQTGSEEFLKCIAYHLPRNDHMLFAFVNELNPFLHIPEADIFLVSSIVFENLRSQFGRAFLNHIFLQKVNKADIMDILIDSIYQLNSKHEPDITTDSMHRDLISYLNRKASLQLRYNPHFCFLRNAFGIKAPDLNVVEFEQSFSEQNSDLKKILFLEKELIHSMGQADMHGLLRKMKKLFSNYESPHKDYRNSRYYFPSLLICIHVKLIPKMTLNWVIVSLLLEFLHDIILQKSTLTQQDVWCLCKLQYSFSELSNFRNSKYEYYEFSSLKYIAEILHVILGVFAGYQDQNDYCDLIKYAVRREYLYERIQVENVYLFATSDMVSETANLLSQSKDSIKFDRRELLIDDQRIECEMAFARLEIALGELDKNFDIDVSPPSEIIQFI